MHLVFDIFQGIGVAAAVGIRPFLPALAVGALALGDVEIHFKGTDYSFLQGAPFLLVLVAGAIVLLAAETRLAPKSVDRGPGGMALGAIGAVLGALLFAGSLCRGHYIVWPGLIGGVLCSAVAFAATRPLFARVRARLEGGPATEGSAPDGGSAAAVPFYAEALALVFAALSVVAPPVGPIGLAVLLWLLIAGRRRDGQKFAGLRILR